MEQSPIIDILREQEGVFSPVIRSLREWPLYELLLKAFETLDRSALYNSRVHGVGHIERTLLLGGVCCMDENLDSALTSLVLDACSYHDVGRIDDSIDPDHGLRSSGKIQTLTGRSGDDLNILITAVTAHSRDDGEMQKLIDTSPVENRKDCQTVSELLKDADGLDRVRINDLDPRFLRRSGSRQRADFAKWLYRRYQQISGLPPVPMYPTPVVEMIRSAGFRPTYENMWDMNAFRTIVGRAYDTLEEQGNTPVLDDLYMRFFRLGKKK